MPTARPNSVAQCAIGVLLLRLSEGVSQRASSESEAVIADAPNRMGVEYEYERQYVSDQGWRTRPDLTFVDAAGDLTLRAPQSAAR
jgi:hypothetical protein